MELVVDRFPPVNDLRVGLPPSTIKMMGLRIDDVLKIVSVHGKIVFGTVVEVPQDSLDELSIALPRCHRISLECHMGEKVMVRPFYEYEEATSVVLAPIAETIGMVTGDFANFILKYGRFLKGSCVWRQMIIPIRMGHCCFEFRVISCGPAKSVIIGDLAVIECYRNPTPRGRSPFYGGISYDDIGGCERQIRIIRRFVEEKLGDGLLVLAPSGCGNTLLAKAIRTEGPGLFI
jgi:hypothetical protein